MIFRIVLFVVGLLALLSWGYIITGRGLDLTYIDMVTVWVEAIFIGISLFASGIALLIFVALDYGRELWRVSVVCMAVAVGMCVMSMPVMDSHMSGWPPGAYALEWLAITCALTLTVQVFIPFEELRTRRRRLSQMQLDDVFA